MARPPGAGQLTAAIDYARTKGRGTLNMSLGFADEAFGPTHGTKQALASACLNAFYAGHLLVASTGNTNDSTKNYPAAFGRRVLGVGASDLYGGRWTQSAGTGSTFGSWVDLVAPGGQYVASAWRAPWDCHDFSSCDPPSYFGGTSASAPLITGVAALLKSYRSNLLGEDIEQIMIRTARDVFQFPAHPGFDVLTGHGIIQASAALDYVAPPRYVRQRSVGFQGTGGVLTVVDSSTDNTTIRFLNRPNDPGLPWQATRVKLAGNGSFGPGFLGAPTAWIRSSGTLGWDSLTTFDFQQDVNWGRIKTGTVTDTSATFETFVYRVAGTPELWFPFRPESARVAYTAVGVVDSQVVGLETQQPSPLALRVSPNPTGGRLTIDFWLPHSTMVRLDVIDVAGRVVATVAERELEGGAHRFWWDGRSKAGAKSPAGIYLCRLRTSGRLEARKFAYVAWPER